MPNKIGCYNWKVTTGVMIGITLVLLVLALIAVYRGPIVIQLYGLDNIGNQINEQLFVILTRLQSHPVICCFTVSQIPIFSTVKTYNRGNLTVSHLGDMHTWDNGTGDYWVQVSPILQSMLEHVPCVCSTMPEPIAVIHFRCADVPFVRHPKYNFAKYRFYTDIIRQEVALYGVQKVVIVYNNTHLSNPTFRRWGDQYAQRLQSQITDVCQVPVSTQSGSTMEDFQVFRCAPVLISVDSSMSFLAAMVNHSRAHVMQSNYRSRHADQTTSYPDHVTEHPRDVLPHDSVHDYGDVDTVCRLLET